MKQSFHAFRALVGVPPIDVLWTGRCQWTTHARVRELSFFEVEERLAKSEFYRLVEARSGTPLRWYPRGNYGFWEHHASLRMVAPGAPPQLPYYKASEWLDNETADRVIVFESP